MGHYISRIIGCVVPVLSASRFYCTSSTRVLVRTNDKNKKLPGTTVLLAIVTRECIKIINSGIKLKIPYYWKSIIGYFVRGRTVPGTSFSSPQPHHFSINNIKHNTTTQQQQHLSANFFFYVCCIINSTPISFLITFFFSTKSFHNRLIDNKPYHQWQHQQHH